MICALKRDAGPRYWHHRPWPFLAKNCSENVSRTRVTLKNFGRRVQQGELLLVGPPPFRISFEGSVSNFFFSRARCFDRAYLLTPGGWSTLVRPCTCQYLPIRQQMCKRSGTLCRWLYRSLFTWMDALRHPDLRLAQSGQYRPHSGVGRALVKYTHVLRGVSVYHCRDR